MSPKLQIYLEDMHHDYPKFKEHKAEHKEGKWHEVTDEEARSWLRRNLNPGKRGAENRLRFSVCLNQTIHYSWHSQQQEN